ncbi:MAG: hypothetical protein ACTMKV_02790 [Sphingomonas parapaucimobilis]
MAGVSGRGIGAGVWIVICALLALGCAFDSMPVGSVFFFVSGVLVLPVTAQRLNAAGISRTVRLIFVAAAALAGCIVIGAKGPPATSSRNGEGKGVFANDPAADKAEADAKKVAEETKKKSGSTGFLNNYHTVLRLAATCDPAIGKVADAAKSRQVVEMYSAAKDGQAACQTAWLEIGKLQPSDDLPKVARDKEAEAIKICANAYFVRQRAMQTVMEIADGEAKPSKVVSAQEDMKLGEAGVMLCVARYIEASEPAGLKPEQMR